MLNCYLDDSYSDQTVIGTIGGYIADAARWAEFEKRSDAVLHEAGVDIFHTFDLVGGRGPFKGWSIFKRSGLIDSLSVIAAQFIDFGLAVAVQRVRYDQRRFSLRDYPKNVRKHFGNKSWLLVCFATAIQRLKNLPEVWQRVEKEGLALIVERGNRHNGGLDAYLDNEIDHGNIPSSVSMAFVAKESSRAIQMADFCACMSRYWIQNKRIHRIEVPEPPLFIPMLFKVKHETYYIEEAVVGGRNVKTGETITFPVGAEDET